MSEYEEAEKYCTEREDCLLTELFDIYLKTYKALE